jgi:hypothetical protein
MYSRREYIESAVTDRRQGVALRLVGGGVGFDQLLALVREECTVTENTVMYFWTPYKVGNDLTS